ncbi:hypothetical protein D9M69_471960 [compost metagenome]
MQVTGGAVVAQHLHELLEALIGELIKEHAIAAARFQRGDQWVLVQRLAPHDIGERFRIAGNAVPGKLPGKGDDLAEVHAAFLVEH